MVKRKFDIENYIDKSIAVHCKTMKELKIFLDYLSDIKHPFPGYNKEDPEHIICIMYSEYGSNLCVFIHNGWTSPTKRSFRFEYGSIRQHENYDILEFSDFDWFTKYDIEDGMVVLTRRGTKYIKLDGHLINETYNASLADYDIDCKCRYSRDEDIMAVYSSKALCLDQRINKLLTETFCYDDYCIWERNDDVVKLTVEDIEKLLGYKVEIVVERENNL